MFISCSFLEIRAGSYIIGGNIGHRLGCPPSIGMPSYTVCSFYSLHSLLVYNNLYWSCSFLEIHAGGGIIGSILRFVKSCHEDWFNHWSDLLFRSIKDWKAADAVIGSCFYHHAKRTCNANFDQDDIYFCPNPLKTVMTYDWWKLNKSFVFNLHAWCWCYIELWWWYFVHVIFVKFNRRRCDFSDSAIHSGSKQSDGHFQLWRVRDGVSTSGEHRYYKGSSHKLAAVKNVCRSACFSTTTHPRKRGVWHQKMLSLSTDLDWRIYLRILHHWDMGQNSPQRQTWVITKTCVMKSHWWFYLLSFQEASPPTSHSAFTGNHLPFMGFTYTKNRSVLVYVWACRNVSVTVCVCGHAFVCACFR